MPNRPFAEQSRALAERVQEGLVRALQQAGYDTVDHGAWTDPSVLGDEAFFLLGPKSSEMARPSQMPGVIGEALFLTNARDANALRDDRVLEAVAGGYFDGIHAYTAALRAPAAESSGAESHSVVPGSLPPQMALTNGDYRTRRDEAHGERRVFTSTRTWSRLASRSQWRTERPAQGADENGDRLGPWMFLSRRRRVPPTPWTSAGS